MRLLRTLTSVPSVHCTMPLLQLASELQRPSSTNLDTCSTFCAGLFTIVGWVGLTTPGFRRNMVVQLRASWDQHHFSRSVDHSKGRKNKLGSMFYQNCQILHTGQLKVTTFRQHFFYIASFQCKLKIFHFLNKEIKIAQLLTHDLSHRGPSDSPRYRPSPGTEAVVSVGPPGPGTGCAATPSLLPASSLCPSAGSARCPGP